MNNRVLNSLIARYVESLFAVVCWCIHAAIAQDKLQLLWYSKGKVTTYDGIAFFKRGTRVGGKKLKGEQLCSYDCIITV
jgi:hypothetical protein